MPGVHFVGELHSCTGFLPNALSFTANRLSSLSAHWAVETKDSANAHWRMMDGESTGKTWLAQREAPNEIAAWNSPLDMTYAFTGIDGWPQMFITVMETDMHDRQDLGGYGVLRLPTSPGLHIRHVPISRPYGESWSEHVTAFFVGGRPRYKLPSDALRTSSRYGTRSISMGVVEVRINVTLQGTNTQEMAHVQFDTDKSQEAVDAASVCTTCPPSATSRHRDAEDEEDDDDDRAGNSDRQALLRKDN